MAGGYSSSDESPKFNSKKERRHSALQALIEESKDRKGSFADIAMA